MNILGNLQKLGRALMLPIAVLPVAALLLRTGQPDLLNIPFIEQAGAAIFNNLPLLFALGVAIGLAKNNDGAAALAGAVGYFVLTSATKTINSTVDMSFFGGIISGVMAGVLYNRFHAVELPQFLAFFGGKRLVPILTGCFSIVLAFIAGYVWPYFQDGISAFSNGIAHAGYFGEFIYGVFNRALIPLGLHHVLNSVLWFTLGSYTDATGHHVIGEIPRFFAGDPTAGTFLAGFYPIMMFGLPAVALAMYFAAPKKNRSQVGGLLFSVALTSFLTGVTEPTEFMFVFLAPGLYLLHAILVGCSFVITNMLGIKDGFGFSAGAFDYLLNWGLATKPILLIPVGLLMGFIYFTTFYWAIKKFDIKTPGREGSIKAVDIDDNEKTIIPQTQPNSRAIQYIELLGGANNLVEVDSCITRLRLVINDINKVDQQGLKAIGAMGVVIVDSTHIQVIIGTTAGIVAEEIKNQL